MAKRDLRSDQINEGTDLLQDEIQAPQGEKIQSKNCNYTRQTRWTYFLTLLRIIHKKTNKYRL